MKISHVNVPSATPLSLSQHIIAAKAAPSLPKQEQDSVELSASARHYTKMLSATRVLQAEEQRLYVQKIERLTQEVREGTYSVSAKAVAERMLGIH